MNRCYIKQENGVVLLEFTIAISLVMIVFFVAIDLYFSFYRFLLLSDATNLATRNISAITSDGELNMQSNAENIIKSYIQNSFNQDPQNISVSVQKMNHATHCTLRINTLWEDACVLCSLTQISPQAFQEVIIEDECAC